MPRVTRAREVEASTEAVWKLISDPHALPRWWPRVARVESVDKTPRGERSQWTKVMATRAGRGVRADYRCLHSTKPSRYVWEQEVRGTPFAKHLASSRTELQLKPAGAGTKVTITLDQRLRGLSRLGGPMMRGAGKKLLDQALDGLEAALTPAVDSSD